MSYKETAKKLAKEPSHTIALFFEDLAEAFENVFDKDSHKDYIDVYDEIVDLVHTHNCSGWEMFFAIFFRIAIIEKVKI